MTESRLKKVCVLGLGYIGLPTTSVIASRGVQVVGVDVKPEVVARINKGEIHIVEPDLDAVTALAVRQGHLRASTTPEPADAYMIAVPTPFHDGKADLDYVWKAARSIAPCLAAGNLVVLESTSPPGTTDAMAALLAELRPDLKIAQPGVEGCDVHVAYCPERVLPGRVLTELVENSRVVGGMTQACAALAEDLYRIFCSGELLRTNARTAEMCKLTENAFRDVNIAFANELSIVCEKLDINVWELVGLANHHPRVNILQPGPGVGGHCIAVDPWFIVEAAPDETRLIRTAREVNDGKPKYVLDKIAAAVADKASGKGRPVVGLLGLAFKPDVDDLRESPALQIAEAVVAGGDCDVVVSEPHIEHLPASLANGAGVRLTDDMHEAVREADVVVMLVNHRLYQTIARDELAGKTVIDTRGIWS